MKRLLLIIFSLGTCLIHSLAQVNSVQFGKNRVQYKKFTWRYYQATNFNVYFSQGGLDIAKFVVQVAEKELPEMERFVEYGLQRRANIVVYNSYNDYRQSNIGMDLDWQGSGGVTKLVNNKLVIYYNSDHNELRRQIREGIARILVENILFGDDIGEFASNQTLLDLPKWLTDGYIAYAAQNWSPHQDDDLKAALLGKDYKNFYQFAFEQPDLAGQAFWYYIEEKYGKESVSYLLYLARLYKNLNRACQQVCKKKFKDVLSDFMDTERQKYYKDIRGRRNVPKGRLTVPQEITKTDYYHFEANPNAKTYTYAVVEYKQGIYSVVLYQNFVDRKILWKDGVRLRGDERDPHYPLLTWDPKGSRLAVTVYEEGKLHLFVYDLFTRTKITKTVLDQFDQIQDIKYMLDPNTLLLSAVKNGHSDIYIYKIKEQKTTQITNDVYDDLDPSFVAFPNKTGILFSSNRPSSDAVGADTSLPSNNHYNVFLIDNWSDSKFKQISQLTKMKYGQARFPMQYNTSHFTFVSDESGISNRYAGFFTTKRAGLDTLVKVGDELLRNPDPKELDSTLKAWDKSQPDSIGYYSITEDSAYVFPLTNYQSGLLETRIAGDKGQVTEVTRQGDFKFLYKLTVDEKALHNRNVNARPTEYRKKVIKDEQIALGLATPYTDEKKPAKLQTIKDTAAKNDFFQSEFSNEKADTASHPTRQGKPSDAFKSDFFQGKDSTGGRQAINQEEQEPNALSKAKLFNYKLKFATDYVVANLNNSVMMSRFQPYAGGTGPIYPANGNDLNGMLRVSISDLLEDYKFVGAIRLATNLKDNEYMFSFQNLRKRIDWGLTYYRSSQSIVEEFPIDSSYSLYSNARTLTNIYQANATYPFDRVRSIRGNLGVRYDKTIIKADYESGAPDEMLKLADENDKYAFMHLEYVYDNTLNPAMNIWKGLRWKIYGDMSSRIGGTPRAGVSNDKLLFNVGFDGRHYLPIYRNVIWAVRASGDFSWGQEKMIYYLGGTDGWISPKFNNNNVPNANVNYAYQTLALNLRGFNQNIANGNNNVVINSEIRLPVFTTFFNKPINNALLRNFQIIQFVDLGTAWEGSISNIGRPTVTYGSSSSNETYPITVSVKAPGVGPFVGGYGFGARSTVLGYFLRFDCAWQMNGVFSGSPKLYFSLGFDF